MKASQIDCAKFLCRCLNPPPAVQSLPLQSIWSRKHPKLGPTYLSLQRQQGSGQERHLGNPHRYCNHSMIEMKRGLGSKEGTISALIIEEYFSKKLFIPMRRSTLAALQTLQLYTLLHWFKTIAHHVLKSSYVFLFKYNSFVIDFVLPSSIVKN